MSGQAAGVYAIVNIWNGNQYIGSTGNLYRRKREHFKQLRAGTHHSGHLQNAFNKYGESAFEFRIILICELDALLYYEQALMDSRVPVYNVFPAARSSRGYRHTEATLAKLRGRVVSEETRIRQSNARKGRIITTEWRKHLSEAGKGREVSEETRRKISVARKGKRMPPPSEETRRKKSDAGRRRRHTEEEKRKISESNKGKHGMSHPRREGWKLSEESRRRMSEGQKQRQAREHGLVVEVVNE